MKFRFLGNLEIKPKPIIFGTTTSPKQTVGFRFNDVETTVDSNDDGYFELYRDKPVTNFETGANKEKLKTLNLSNFDTSKVRSMCGTFRDCSGLTSLDISNWNTSQVTDMSSMFYNCSSLASLDLSNWNTSQVQFIDGMFRSCNGLVSLDLSHFDITKAYTFSTWMFHDCPSLKIIKVLNEKWANKLISRINSDLNKTATWNPETKIITIPE